MYATVDAMRRKFGDSELIQLTDNEAPYLNAINMDKLNGAMQEANSEIDAYVGSRYALPLHIVPPFLVEIGCNLARYYAVTGDLSENDPIKNRYESSIKTLTKISKGELILGGSPVGESKPVQSSSNNVMFTVGRRDFGNGGW
ncbi:gp436 family protein [Acinetobacter sp.]|uniref:gp436 family protein n=1 Tax=Acinetobacter sp. TaxID=472 RepID=UPI003D092604